MELHDGDIIVFKDTIQIYSQNIYFWSLSFNVSIIGYNYNGITFGQSNYLYFVTGTSQSSQGTKSTVYTGSWANDGYKTITIRGNQTITDEAFINWLYENTVSGLPVSEIEKSYQGTNNFLTATVANIGQIINPVISNPVTGIFTIGIFLVSIAVGILHRLRRKTF